MKNYMILLIAGCLLLAASCKKKNNEEETIKPTSSVETSPPNSSYKPAFEGQTRINAIRDNRWRKIIYDRPVIKIVSKFCLISTRNF